MGLATIVFVSWLSLGVDTAPCSEKTNPYDTARIGYRAIVQNDFQTASKCFEIATSTFRNSNVFGADYNLRLYGEKDEEAVPFKRMAVLLSRLKPGSLALKKRTILESAEIAEAENNRSIARDLYELNGWALYFNNKNLALEGNSGDLPNPIKYPKTRLNFAEWARLPGDSIHRASKFAANEQERILLINLRDLAYSFFDIH